MLDPWIIEEIRRREEEDREHREQPVLELPLERPAFPLHPDHGKAPEGVPRGVVIVDFSI